eukprot:gene14892-1061_t
MSASDESALTLLLQESAARIEAATAKNIDLEAEHAAKAAAFSVQAEGEIARMKEEQELLEKLRDGAIREGESKRDAMIAAAQAERKAALDEVQKVRAAQLEAEASHAAQMLESEQVLQQKLTALEAAWRVREEEHQKALTAYVAAVEEQVASMAAEQVASMASNMAQFQKVMVHGGRGFAGAGGGKDSTTVDREKVMSILNSSPKPNFSGMDLRGLDLSDIDFSGASLHGAKLAGATMDRVRLQNTVLSGVDLRGLNLSGADLRGAVFEGALNWKDAVGNNLRGAVLSGMDLSGVDLSGVDVSRAVFKGALNLKDAKHDNLRGAVLSGVDLSGADLSGVDLSGADLSGAVFKGALNLKDAKLDNLRGADLSGADLSGADLTGVTGLQSIVLGTGGQHTANVAGCKHRFSHRGDLSKGEIVIVDTVLAKVTRPAPSDSNYMYYTTSSGSEGCTNRYVVPS